VIDSYMAAKLHYHNAIVNVETFNTGRIGGKKDYFYTHSNRSTPGGPTLEVPHMLIVLRIQTFHVLQDRHFAYPKGAAVSIVFLSRKSPANRADAKRPGNDCRALDSRSQCLLMTRPGHPQLTEQRERKRPRRNPRPSLHFFTAPQRMRLDIT
jgi:hypothetical protein